MDTTGVKGHAEPLRRELRPLYLGRKHFPPVVALAAYFDESDERTPGILTVAGYVASVEAWDKIFTPAWNAMLDAAPHRLEEYKHSDCRQGKRQFVPPWTQEERDALTVQAVENILEFNRQDWVMGFGAGLFLDYPILKSEDQRQGFAEFALGRCFAMLLTNLLRWAEPLLGGDELQLVYDYRNNLRGRVTGAFEIFERNVPELAGRVRVPTFPPSKGLPPLQAADLLAYETRKEVKNRMDRPPRAPSRALQRLVDEVPHYADLNRLPLIFGEIPGEWQYGGFMPGDHNLHAVVYDSRAVPNIR